MTQWLEPGRTGVAPVELGEIFAGLFGPRAPLRFSAYDGSVAGLADSAVGIRFVRPRAASYLATAPGALGLVRAYLRDDIEIEGVHPGNPYPLMRLFEDDMQIRTPSPAQALRWLRGLGLRTFVPPTPTPP
jgi:cyclopropane-fatty-acyl-phospholipid synthase